MSMNPFFSLSLTLLLGCAPSLLQKPENAVSLAALARRHDAQNALSGYCDIKLNKKTIRGTAQIALRSDTTVFAVIDELGIPLALAAIGDSFVDVQRIFPPFSSSLAKKTGIAMHAYRLAASKRYTSTGLFYARLPHNNAALVFARQSGPDSLHLYRGSSKTPARMLFSNDNAGFILINRQGDTALAFVAL
jgi:hypothetical protein